MKKIIGLIALLLVLFLFAMPVAAETENVSENFIENKTYIQEEVTCIGTSENMTDFSVNGKKNIFISSARMANYDGEKSFDMDIFYNKSGTVFNSALLRSDKAVDTGYEVVTNLNKNIAEASGGPPA